MPGMDLSHVDQKISIKEEREKTRPCDRNDGNEIGINRKHNDGRKGVQKEEKQLI